MRKFKTLNLFILIYLVLTLSNLSKIKADDLKLEKKFNLITYFEYDYAKKNVFQKTNALKYEYFGKNIINLYLGKNPDKNNYFFKRRINLNLKLRNDPLCNKNTLFLKKMFVKQSKNDHKKLSLKIDRYLSLDTTSAILSNSIINKISNEKKKKVIEKNFQTEITFENNFFPLLQQSFKKNILFYSEILFNKILKKNNLYNFNFLDTGEIILIYKIKVPSALSEYNELEFDLPKNAENFLYKINLRYNTNKIITDIQALKFDTRSYNIDTYKDDLNVIYLHYKLPANYINKLTSKEIKYSYLNKIIFSKMEFTSSDSNTMDPYTSFYEMLGNYHASSDSNTMDPYTSFYEMLENYHGIYNNYLFYDLKLLLNRSKKNLNNGLMLIDINQCVQDLNPMITKFYKKINLKKTTQEENKIILNNKIDEYTININDKLYNVDQIIFDGDEYNGIKSDKNFFVTSLSKLQFMELKKIKVNKFNHFLGDNTVYIANDLIDDNLNKFKLNVDIKIKNKFFFLFSCILLFLTFISLIIFRKKKILINNKIYNFFYGILVFIFIFLIFQKEIFLIYFNNISFLIIIFIIISIGIFKNETK